MSTWEGAKLSPTEAAALSGYRAAIDDIKAAGISVTRGACFDIVVELERKLRARMERSPSVRAARAKD